MSTIIEGVENLIKILKTLGDETIQGVKLAFNTILSYFRGPPKFN